MPQRCKAPRNKTIELTAKETAAYAALALKNQKTYSTDEVTDRIICGDSLKIMPKLPPNSVDLMIADPPYNLTKTF
ncbi:MAG: site-specific DNA-methyltransferase, partial [Alphaproteobacteria bacterium]|nr:site-specific DNA-methyltransferase [Alphaproteobacteria bacterium]